MGRRAVPAAAESLESRCLLAATPVLVSDINQTASHFAPQVAFANTSAQVGGVTFFRGHATVADGPELFKTDGTQAGTVLVKDIWPGTAGSSPQNFVAINGILFFTADDGVNGQKLWKSDGTTAGTVKVGNVSNFGPMAQLAGSLYFVGNVDGVYGFWKTDGTIAGTVRVTDSTTGAPAATPTEMVALGDALIYGALTTSTETALYRVVGTTATFTTTVPSTATRFTAINGSVYFTNRSSNNGQAGDLYRTDGTAAGTTLIKRIDYMNGPIDATFTGNITASGDVIYFLSRNRFNGTPSELWRSDGTTAGTFPITIASSVTLDALRPLGEHSVLFSKEPAYEQWVSDGTVEGTRRLADLAPDSGGFSRTTYPLPGGRALLITGTQFWTTDGTAAGTRYGVDQIEGMGPHLGFLNGAVLFHGRDGLYRSDGTAAGTYTFGVTLPGNGSGLRGLVPRTMLKVGQSLYFTASDGPTGSELWRTLPGGVERVADIAPGSASSDPRHLTLGGDGSLYFTAGTATTGEQLYRLAPGTALPQRVSDIPRVGNYPTISMLTAVGNALYFSFNDSSFAQNLTTLWRYDPATSSVGPVKVGDHFLVPSPIVRAGNFWYFGAQMVSPAGVGAGGQHLFKISAGASETPQDVLNRTAANETPVPVGSIGSILLFNATASGLGRELWRTDGTTAGTALLKDLSTGSDSGFPEIIGSAQTVPAGGVLYFKGRVTASSEIFRTDGTAAGTYAIPNLRFPRDVATINGTTYFLAADSAGNAVFARTDGNDSDGLLHLTSLTSNGLYPISLTAFDGQIYVVGTAADRVELWSLGSTPGTLQKVAVLGPAGSSLYYIESAQPPTGRSAPVATDSDLYFPMLTPATGVELFRLHSSNVPITATANFEYDKRQAVVVRFSEDIGTSLAVEDLTFTNFTTGAAVPVGAIAYDPATWSATVTFAGTLANANYRLTLAAGAVADAVGNLNGVVISADFHVLAGDANRDRAVNFNDFLALQASFGRAGTFSQGDFNYDGQINFNDFLILQANFGASVAAIGAGGAVTAGGKSGAALPLPGSGVGAESASLAGTAFNDNNRNGKFDRGDGVGRGVRVFLDADHDGRFDADEASVVTDNAGKYKFNDLAAGTYRVRRVFAAGQAYSTPLLNVKLASRQAKTGQLIGMKRV